MAAQKTANVSLATSSHFATVVEVDWYWGWKINFPIKVCGTNQSQRALGDLTSRIRKDTGILTNIYELFEDNEAKTGRVVVIEVPTHPVGEFLRFSSTYRRRADNYAQGNDATDSK